MAAALSPPQRRVDAALHDPEQRLIGPRVSSQATLGPGVGARHGRGHLSGRQRRIHQLVEGHGDVAAQRLLDLDRALGREALARPVQVAGEGHAVVVDSAQVGQAEHLETARIGQDRAVPAHEPMEPAQRRDAFVAGAQRQVVGVGQQDLGARRAQVGRGQALDARLGPDRHELRGIDRPMRSLQPAEPSPTDAGGARREADGRHGGEPTRSCRWAERSPLTQSSGYEVRHAVGRI